MENFKLFYDYVIDELGNETSLNKGDLEIALNKLWIKIEKNNKFGFSQGDIMYYADSFVIGYKCRDKLKR